MKKVVYLLSVFSMAFLSSAVVSANEHREKAQACIDAGKADKGCVKFFKKPGLEECKKFFAGDESLKEKCTEEWKKHCEKHADKHGKEHHQ